MTAVQPDYLSDEFLHRVRAAYRRAIAAVGKTKGMWAGIDARRADVHAALMAESGDALRAIFADPASTDLFYGVDNLCRSISGPRSPDRAVRNPVDASPDRKSDPGYGFLERALANERGALAAKSAVY